MPLLNDFISSIRSENRDDADHQTLDLATRQLRYLAIRLGRLQDSSIDFATRLAPRHIVSVAARAATGAPRRPPQAFLSCAQA